MQLGTVDLTTGAVALIGNIGFGAVYGLTFCCGHLYGATAAGELLDVNAATGAGRLIGRNNVTQWGMTTRCCCCRCC